MNDSNNTGRLARQIAFLLEIDKLKSILRQTYLVNEPRHENSAEHSWHLAMAALILAEHANEPVDSLRVLKMLLVHDIVEIDAGDTYVYAVQTEKAALEEAAAERVFGLLPEDQRSEVRGLWEEFEARETPDAKFAAGLDRIMPILHNYHTEGRSWRAHGITRSQVLARNGHTAAGSEVLWEYILTLIDDATAKGYLIDDREKEKTPSPNNGGTGAG